MKQSKKDLEIDLKFHKRKMKKIKKKIKNNPKEIG